MIAELITNFILKRKSLTDKVLEIKGYKRKGDMLVSDWNGDPVFGQFLNPYSHPFKHLFYIDCHLSPSGHGIENKEFSLFGKDGKINVKAYNNLGMKPCYESKECSGGYQGNVVVYDMPFRPSFVESQIKVLKELHVPVCFGEFENNSPFFMNELLIRFAVENGYAEGMTKDEIERVKSKPMRYAFYPPLIDLNIAKRKSFLRQFNKEIKNKYMEYVEKYRYNFKIKKNRDQEFFKKLFLIRNRIRNKDYVDISRIYNSILYPHQIEDIRKLATINGSALIANDMGTGKTLVAIAAACIFKMDTVLVLAPKRLIPNWQKTVEKYKIGNIRFYFLSHEGIDLIGTMEHSYYDLCIIDEGHIFRNSNMKVSRINNTFNYSFKWESIRRKILIDNLWRFKRIYLLTGTPIVNNKKDLISLMNIVRRERVPDTIFINLGDWKHKAEGTCGPDAWEYYSEDDFFDCIIRRDNSIILQKQNIKPPSIKRIIVTMEEKQRQAYNNLPLKSFEWNKIIGATLPVYGRIYNSFITHELSLKDLSDEEILEAFSESEKLMYLKDIAKDSLVFSQSVVLLKFLHRAFTLFGMSPALIVGDVSIEERNRRIEEVSKRKYDFILASSKCAGVGLNIQFLSKIVFVDSGWTFKDISQCIGRCLRFGQKNTVLVYFLLSEGTVDEKMYNIIEDKRNLAREILSKINEC